MEVASIMIYTSNIQFSKLYSRSFIHISSQKYTYCKKYQTLFQSGRYLLEMFFFVHTLIEWKQAVVQSFLLKIPISNSN